MILNQILVIKGERFCFEITINQPCGGAPAGNRLTFFCTVPVVMMPVR